MLNQLKQLIKEYEENADEIITICDTLRRKELELKTRKYELEFDEEFTEGLKVKEIPSKIHQETLEEQEKIIDLKHQKDQLELQHKVLRLKIEYTKEVIDSEKQ